MVCFANCALVSKFPRVHTFAFRTRIRTYPTCSAAGAQSKNVVFLGTPAVAATVLQKVWDASKQASASSEEGSFNITGVVTQPPAPVGRKRVLTPSPVHSLAENLGIDVVLTPSSARDEAFLQTLIDLRPDLCITAAYGNFLPQKFLDIPKLGTVNIHPSLLPKFRGAAPVPRALESGVTKTGVSIAFTELQMDSGPIIAQTEIDLDGSEQAPELLQDLFDVGADRLVGVMPSIFSGAAVKSAVLQNEDDQTQAPKLSKEEARLTFTENAVHVHNKVRAFAGWPGTWAQFVAIDPSGGEIEELRLKIMKSEVLRREGAACLGVHDIKMTESGELLAIVCDDGSVLGVSTVQPPGKKAMPARSFWNGLRGKVLERKRVPH